MSDLLNLEKQLRFYGAYHHNPVNIAIHIACVPVLLLTAFSMATNTGTLIETPEWATVPYLDLNLGTMACLTYSSLYILMEPVAGTSLSVLLLAGTAAGRYIVLEYGIDAIKWMAGVHIFSWLAQFVGHGKFEGRAPALLDNIFQAFFLAPLFVWLEILFAAGYRPELRNRIDKMVEQDVAKFRTSKGLTNGHANGHAKSS